MNIFLISETKPVFSAALNCPRHYLVHVHVRIQTSNMKLSLTCMMSSFTHVRSEIDVIRVLWESAVTFVSQFFLFLFFAAILPPFHSWVMGWNNTSAAVCSAPADFTHLVVKVSPHSSFINTLKLQNINPTEKLCYSHGAKLNVRNIFKEGLSSTFQLSGSAHHPAKSPEDVFIS